MTRLLLFLLSVSSVSACTRPALLPDAGTTSGACSASRDCDDGNPCNGAETCASPGTASSRCVAGTPPADGAACDADMRPATRDICRTGACVLSTCGDGFVDTGAAPPELCDDRNMVDGDGCSAACQLEMQAFRITQLSLVSPRIIVGGGGFCLDVTDLAMGGINGTLANRLQPVSAGGLYTLHLVGRVAPYALAMGSSPIELHTNASCVEAPMPDACGPAAMPAVTSSVAHGRGSGTCFVPVAADVDPRAGMPAMYSPGIDTVSAPCFATDPADLTLPIGGDVPLQQASLSLAYGTAAGTFVGVLTGFLPESVAADLPAPVVFGASTGVVYSHLQAGGRTATDSAGATVASACNLGGGVAEDDEDSDGGTPGFWFFFNVQAELVTWTGP